MLQVYLIFTSISWHVEEHKHFTYSINTNTKNVTQETPANSFLFSTFHTLHSAGKGAGFVSVMKEDYKCEVFYYLALKAWNAATVIILTTVLFYKIIKDDETALPESELALSLFMEVSLRCSLFFQETKGMNLKKCLNLFPHHLSVFLCHCLPLSSL